MTWRFPIHFIRHAAPLRWLGASLLASVLWLPACSRTGEATAADNLTAQAARDGASVGVQIDTNELRTVDRLRVRVRAVAPAGLIAREIVFEPETEGWTVVSQSVPAVSLTPQGDAIRTVDYVLEPFLEGDYLVPAAAGVFAVPAATETVSLSTDPLPVRVMSVLAAESSVTDLAPAAMTLEVPPIRASPSVLPWLALGLVVVAAGAAAAAWRLSQAEHNSAPSLANQLRDLREHLSTDPMEARDQIASTLRGTPPICGAVEQLLQTLDLERFGGRSACKSDANVLLDAAIAAAAQAPPEAPDAAPNAQGASA